jgi:putative copper resistance protein D
LPIVVAVIALVPQWAQQDRRAATRSDRHVDAAYADELDAYSGCR